MPELRARIGPLHAVAITARGLADDEARSRGVGFQAHLAKPFTPHELVEFLTGCRRCLEMQGQVGEAHAGALGRVQGLGMGSVAAGWRNEVYSRDNPQFRQCPPNPT